MNHTAGSRSWLWRFLPRKAQAWLLERFGDVTPPVRRGYGLWLAVGAVIAIPEIWAAVARPPWPTISGTVGHLELRWNFVAVIVVAVLVIVAAHAIRIPVTGKGQRPRRDLLAEEHWQLLRGERRSAATLVRIRASAPDATPRP